MKWKIGDRFKSVSGNIWDKSNQNCKITEIHNLYVYAVNENNSEGLYYYGEMEPISVPDPYFHIPKIGSYVRTKGGFSVGIREKYRWIPFDSQSIFMVIEAQIERDRFFVRLTDLEETGETCWLGSSFILEAFSERPNS